MDAGHSAALSRLLFNRSRVPFDPQPFVDARVLITGAGGSIGGAIAKQLAHVEHIRELVLLDHSEHGLYQTLKAIGPNAPVTPVLNDIRNMASTGRVFDRFRPDIVIHAAALKHVPMLEIEHNVMQAMQTNILGTRNVCTYAALAKAKKVVVVSTDKAVNPSSVLGLTKRAAELVMCQSALKYDETEFSAVRFGNVINTSGSAVPLFKEQIAAGGPVTITDMAMTRYMMTMADAVVLTLSTAGMSQQGRPSLFVLEMGEPVRIIDLAYMLIRLADKEPGIDIELKEIGIRPGEKLDEELFYSREAVTQTAVPGVMQTGLPELSEPELRHLDDVVAATMNMDIRAAKQGLQALVPEYTGRWAE